MAPYMRKPYHGLPERANNILMNILQYTHEYLKTRNVLLKFRHTLYLVSESL